MGLPWDTVTLPSALFVLECLSQDHEGSFSEVPPPLLSPSSALSFPSDLHIWLLTQGCDMSPP